MELDALIGALAPSDVIGRRPVEILDLAYDTRRVGAGTLQSLTRRRGLPQGHQRPGLHRVREAFPVHALQRPVGELEQLCIPRGVRLR